MKYMAIIDTDEKPISCEFIGCNGNVTPHLIGATNDIKALDQEPKTGHWVNKSWTMGCGVQIINVECSCCGKSSGLSHTSAPYCPNCGAKMVKPQESEE